MKRQTAITTFLLSASLFLTPHIYAEQGTTLLNDSQNKYSDVVVERVLQADRIVLSTGEKIRLIGLRAPEPPPKEKLERNEFGFIVEPPVTPESSIEEEALRLARELMENKHVRLEFDVQKKGDSYDTLAYVFLPDGRMVNTEILRQGLAYLQIQPPNFKYEDQLRAAYKEAREEKRGLQAE